MLLVYKVHGVWKRLFWPPTIQATVFRTSFRQKAIAADDNDTSTRKKSWITKVALLLHFRGNQLKVIFERATLPWRCIAIQPSSHTDCCELPVHVANIQYTPMYRYMDKHPQ